MIKQVLYLFLAIVFASGCKEVTKETLPIQAEYYDFINTQFPNDKLKCIVLDSPSFGEIDKDYMLKMFHDLNSIISDEDRCYMMLQFDTPTNFKWEQGKLTNSIIVQNQQLDSILHLTRSITDFKNDKEYISVPYGYFKYSKPIFNKNKTLCIFAEYHECGFMCGGGSYGVYQKQNGNWKKIHGGHSVE